MVAKKKKEHSEDHVDKGAEDEVVEIPVGKYFDRVRANPWIASTFVLGLLFLGVLIFGGGSSGGTAISADEAGERVLEFINSNPQITGEVSLASVVDDGQFYQVMLNYDGQQVPVHTTKDGEFLVSNPVALGGTEGTDAADSTTTPSTPPTPTPEVPKSDKPEVELFIMSHCPYGTQMEKGIIPVVELLGDSIDFELKFVYYAMHGEPEVTEQANQYCIQEEQEEKLLPYLKCFLEEGDGDGCLVKTGVNKLKLDTCVARIDTEFDITKNLEDRASWLSGRFPMFNTHKAENDAYGVRGSPTLVVNGQQASSGRDAASLLSAICGAFNEAPEACSTDLSSAGSPAPGFGWDPGAAAGAAAAGCGV